MKTAGDLIQNIIQKKSSPTPALRPINPIQEIFSLRAPSEEEKQKLFLVLSPHLKEEDFSEKLKEDIEKIAKLSLECSSIQKQGVLLLGEKITQAKETFHQYSGFKALFSTWIKNTFSSEKTAYNALAFYELYLELKEEELKEKLKKMPLKASYILASKKGDIEEKKAIIQANYLEKSEEILSEISKKFPLAEDDKRQKKASVSSLLKKMSLLLEAITLQTKDIKADDLAILMKMSLKIQKLINKDH